MKTACVIAMGLAVQLILMCGARAQGTMYLSGLDTPATGTLPVGSDAWVATYFATGAAPAGYTLDSIQLAFEGVGGNPSGLKVMLWDFQNNQPIITLTGSDPSGAGVSIYHASGFSLSPLSVYWFVVTSTTPISVGTFSWNHSSSSPVGIELWHGGGYQTSSNGLVWTRDNPGGTPQFAVTATPIPEPSTFAFLSVGGFVLAAARMRVKAKR